jgi:single-stranded DNA-specific DHH superfamily exonuclease
MEYLLGSEKDFQDFVESIGKEDKVGIITHTDLDGIASALFLELILNSKKINVEKIDFISYKKGMFDDSLREMSNLGITKVFITDIYADGGDLDGF